MSDGDLLDSMFEEVAKEVSELIGKAVVEAGWTESVASSGVVRASVCGDGACFAAGGEARNQCPDEHGDIEFPVTANTTRARELARELDRLAGDANSSAQQLMESYTRIENATGADLSVAEQSVMNVSEEIWERHETVVVETFVRTNLSMRADDDTASFADPASVRGQITLENGTALQNETVEIQVGEQVKTVQTDSDGEFALDYRPVTVLNDTENVSVTYRPEPASVYLGSNATLNVTVEQTTATLNVTSDTDTAQFGDDVTVSGRVHVNGTPVEGARVRVSIDGTSVGTVETGPSGTYNLTTALPLSR